MRCHECKKRGRNKPEKSDQREEIEIRNKSASGSTSSGDSAVCWTLSALAFNIHDHFPETDEPYQHGLNCFGHIERNTFWAAQRVGAHSSAGPFGSLVLFTSSKNMKDSILYILIELLIFNKSTYHERHHVEDPFPLPPSGFESLNF